MWPCTSNLQRWIPFLHIIFQVRMAECFYCCMGRTKDLIKMLLFRRLLSWLSIMSRTSNILFHTLICLLLSIWKARPLLGLHLLILIKTKHTIILPLLFLLSQRQIRQLSTFRSAPSHSCTKFRHSLQYNYLSSWLFEKNKSDQN